MQAVLRPVTMTKVRYPGHSWFSPGRGVNLAWQAAKLIEAYRVLRAVAGDELTDASMDVGAHVSATLSAIAESARTRRWVSMRDTEPRCGREGGITS
jgi:hypothetical protein